MKKSIHSQEYKLFLELLREVRETANLTQDELAERLGSTQSFVSKCERGERRLDLVELQSWCSALEISMRDFVSRFEDTQN
jgi:transcriptional regulator with XRE-family HTH domain